ncbi:unnamed protein product [Effrenium voratum]|uniref:Uncharacterized protein n=1 Tax=Effrenium voratum TaxID=2562239 RepID=A0AA36J7D4_9DINO|nr:unnamed protein product [Effrenium voratum]CAJ1400439.1 unnamed protein product [Effrenium voratum]
MIYCFEAAGRVTSGVCSTCGSACSSCSHACNNACNSIQCTACCKSLTNVSSRPLGCFVILAFLLNVPAGILAVLSALDEEVQRCRAAPVLAWCYGALMLSITNAAFAFYMQHKLASAIESGTQRGARDIFRHAGTIVLYDFVFCFYIMLFAAGFVFCFLGVGWWQTCHIHSWEAVWAALLLLFFAFGTMGFTCCWGFAVGCWGGLEALGLSSSLARIFFGVREQPVVFAAPVQPAPYRMAAPGANTSQALRPGY